MWVTQHRRETLKGKEVVLMKRKKIRKKERKSKTISTHEVNINTTSR